MCNIAEKVLCKLLTTGIKIPVVESINWVNPLKHVLHSSFCCLQMFVVNTNEFPRSKLMITRCYYLL